MYLFGWASPKQVKELQKARQRMYHKAWYYQTKLDEVEKLRKEYLKLKAADEKRTATSIRMKKAWASKTWRNRVSRNLSAVQG